MYCIVANSFSGIVRTQAELDALSSVLPFPKYRRFETEDECLAFLHSNKRTHIDANHVNIIPEGCLVATFIVDNGKLFCSIDITKVGDVSILASDIIKIQRHSTYVSVIGELSTKKDSILQQVDAVATILRCVGNFVNINIKLNDVSTYLALTRYTGANTLIRSVQNTIRNRLGNVFFEV